MTKGLIWKERTWGKRDYLSVCFRVREIVAEWEWKSNHKTECEIFKIKPKIYFGFSNKQMKKE